LKAINDENIREKVRGKKVEIIWEVISQMMFLPCDRFDIV
jgi:hypothetical protein